MGKLSDLVSHIRTPKMVEVRQKFPRPRIVDVESELRRQLEESGVRERIRPGGEIAITGGSRGIANIALILRETARFVKACGGRPFIIPAMGSHGGATATGQVEILNALGITEEYCECPIRAAMDTVLLGHTEPDGLPVYVDAHAVRADGVILVGRIKPHPSFVGEVESGLAKMAVIGLGKQKGAALCHGLGMGNMSKNIKEIAEVIFRDGNVLFGVGLIENAYDETSRIAVVEAERILEKEPALLREAYGNFPKISFPSYDVLLVEEMGKNISGAGMDTMIISRYTHDGIPKDPHQQMICVLDLTGETHGNACGMGLVDVAPKRFRDKVDFENTYPNLLTSRIFGSAKLPMIMEDDRSAIQAAIYGCTCIDYDNPKLIWMKNTLDIGRLFISEALWEEAQGIENVEIVGRPFDMEFRENGDLIRIDEREIERKHENIVEM